MPEVVAAARSAGLRWIIITDHDTLEGRSSEGWHDDVFVTFGHEITPPQSHFLAFNLDYVVNRDQPVQDFVDEVYAQGGFGIIAHPDDKKPDTGHRWYDWSVDGPRQRTAATVMGLELWNLMSDWRTLHTERNRLMLHLFPSLGLRGPTPATLAWWDTLNMAGKRTFGIGGLDAHAFKREMPWGTMKVFPYRWLFKTLTNYLLLDAPLAADVAHARQQIFGAFTGGRTYFVNRLWGSAPPLKFTVQRGRQRWTIGDSPSLAEGALRLHADAGCRAALRLLQNGQVVCEGVRHLKHEITTPGIYRLEGYRNRRPWLYTNPLYVT